MVRKDGKVALGALGVKSFSLSVSLSRASLPFIPSPAGGSLLWQMLGNCASQQVIRGEVPARLLAPVASSYLRKGGILHSSY